MTGPTNPSAVNYDPAATEDDGSGLYLRKVDGACMLFSEVPEVLPRHFTVSYSPIAENWVFFHGYFPNQYLQTREQLYTVHGNKLYKHNAGPPGLYYGTAPEPFFLDLVVVSKRESILSAIQWVTEVFLADKDQELETFTHITVWNNNQCTGRLALSTVMEYVSAQTRKSQGHWNFNMLRDIVIDHDVAFLEDLLQDFAVIDTAIDVTLPWYEKELLVDNHFIIRLEYGNTENKKIVFHSYGATLDDSY
jgi:hypothetical protein